MTVNHLIEHVPDPVGLLKECRRVLKPGGRFILGTPNSESFGRLLFKADWRGLEPPRHLYLFCPSSIGMILNMAGFNMASIRSLNSSYMCWHSFLLWSQHFRRNGWYRSKLGHNCSFLCSHSSWYREWLLRTRRLGECLAVEAVNIYHVACP